MDDEYELELAIRERVTWLDALYRSRIRARLADIEQARRHRRRGPYIATDGPARLDFDALRQMLDKK